MADVSARTPIFSRGSTVLDYWLVHAEGLTIQPLGARVEEVVVTAPIGHAESLVVRSRVTRRRKTIPADAIAAVSPSAGELLLDAPVPKPKREFPRPSPEHIAAARALAAGSARRTQAGTSSAVAWTKPRAEQAGASTARFGRLIVAGAAAGLAWLWPRCVEFAQMTVLGGVLVARGAVRVAQELERAAAAGVQRGHASLEARRTRQQPPSDD
jgi:hypothetical protein